MVYNVFKSKIILSFFQVTNITIQNLDKSQKSGKSVSFMPKLRKIWWTNFCECWVPFCELHLLTLVTKIFFKNLRGKYLRIFMLHQ